jgi:glycosyltransferase involved in cell wall biosynthesis
VSVPRVASKLLYRCSRSAWLHRIHERRFANAFEPGDVAWLWPASSADLCEELFERGVPVLLEQINAHMGFGKRVLDAVYRRQGLAPTHIKTQATIDDEARKLAAATWLFSPSPFVTESLLSEGYPEERILPTSYGWDPHRFQPRVDPSPTLGGPTFLCVCYGGIRKGIPQLFDAWAGAKLKGKLMLVGGIDDDVRRVSARHAGRADVDVLPPVDDLVAVYESADAFVLASHEEGSPLVTYLALAAGLPCIVSPAAGSGLVRDGVEGFVVDPWDEERWAEALRRVAEDEDLRQRMAEAALARSREFTWRRVAERRAEQIEKLLVAPPMPRLRAVTA